MNVPLRLAACLLLLLSGHPALPQDLSHDGRRWVEIEVTVFTQEGPRRAERELARPDTAALAYPARLRRLDSRSELYRVDFPPLRPAALPSDAPALPAAAPAPLYGPEEAVATREFRVFDPERDAFVLLEGAARKFLDLNRRLRDSGRRLLHHVAWRQPTEALADTQAVFVRGGERRGEHEELEGSLRVTQIPGGVDLNVNLWLSRFEPAQAFGGFASRGGFGSATAAGFGSDQQRGLGGTPGLDNPLIWRLPEQPFPAPAPPMAEPLENGLARQPSPGWRVVEVAPLQQIRSITNDSLHYFDHPDFGVLVQVRPYQLPEAVSRFSFE